MCPETTGTYVINPREPQSCPKGVPFERNPLAAVEDYGDRF